MHHTAEAKVLWGKAKQGRGGAGTGSLQRLPLRLGRGLAGKSASDRLGGSAASRQVWCECAWGGQRGSRMGRTPALGRTEALVSREECMQGWLGWRRVTGCHVEAGVGTSWETGYKLLQMSRPWSNWWEASNSVCIVKVESTGLAGRSNMGRETKAGSQVAPGCWPKLLEVWSCLGKWKLVSSTLDHWAILPHAWRCLELCWGRCKRSWLGKSACACDVWVCMTSGWQWWVRRSLGFGPENGLEMYVCWVSAQMKPGSSWDSLGSTSMSRWRPELWTLALEVWEMRGNQ